jgi:uncharacterized membrane protein YgcG
MFRHAVPVAAALVALFLASGSARANPGINGYSGKPYFGVGDTCDTNCHKPSTPIPTITLTIPTTVQAGSKNDVTLVVAGTRVRTSFDAAFSDGVVVTAGSNTNVPFPVETPDEVVAVDPPPAGATGTYKFSFTAPKTNGTITLWVAAMSASGAGNVNDGVAKTTRTITVTGGTNPTPDAGTTSSSGGSSGSTASSGTTTDGGASSSSGGESASSSSGSGASGRRLPSSDDGGCHAASSSDLSWIVVALAITAAARGRARRRSTARERS